MNKYEYEGYESYTWWQKALCNPVVMYGGAALIVAGFTLLFIHCG